ncbi:ParA family protein [Lacticaseibacillus paracasei]|uniref:ParA family protein n=1 Tax=Lacticaseibacillus paracasei TaxID=1597 RepID=UPI0022E88353|nr:AAA family ATPase [Lacticaseibacillus paracasei]
MTAKVISFINMKGGVGKTTLCKEIGYNLAHQHSKQVLLIDIDPQINLTQAVFGYYNFAQSDDIKKKIEKREVEDAKKRKKVMPKQSKKSLDKNKDKKLEKIKVSTKSINHLFQGTTVSSSEPSKIIQKLDSSFSIIPGELGIEFITRNLNSNQIENGIYDFIRKNELRNQFDFILIDCPPTYSSYTVAALKPSDYFIIPVHPEVYSLLGVDMLLNVVENVVKENDLYFEGKPLRDLGVIFTDIVNSPSKWTTDFMSDMRNSKKLKQRGVTFFSNSFIHNEAIKKDMSYFIDNSNAKAISKPNLKDIVTELLERIDKDAN